MFNFSTLETVIEDKPKLGRPPTSERVAIPRLKNTVTKRDAALINKIRVEVRRKIEDDFDGDY